MVRIGKIKFRGIVIALCAGIVGLGGLPGVAALSELPEPESVREIEEDLRYKDLPECDRKDEDLSKCNARFDVKTYWDGKHEKTAKYGFSFNDTEEKHTGAVRNIVLKFRNLDLLEPNDGGVILIIGFDPSGGKYDQKEIKPDDILPDGSFRFDAGDAVRVYILRKGEAKKGYADLVNLASIEVFRRPVSPDTLVQSDTSSFMDVKKGDGSSVCGIGIGACGAFDKIKSIARIVNGENEVCTGFLVGDNLLLTNHHCLMMPTNSEARGAFLAEGGWHEKSGATPNSKPDCDDWKVWFDYYDPDDPSKESRYYCDHIVALSAPLDFALVRIKFETKDGQFDQDRYERFKTREKLSLLDPGYEQKEPGSKAKGSGAGVVLLGHPLGMRMSAHQCDNLYTNPSKALQSKFWSKNWWTKLGLVETEQDAFQSEALGKVLGHTCQTKSGNSGSPIMDVKTGVVLALHSQSAGDNEACSSSGRSSQDEYVDRLYRFMTKNRNRELDEAIRNSLVTEYQSWMPVRSWNQAIKSQRIVNWLRSQTDLWKEIEGELKVSKSLK